MKQTHAMAWRAYRRAGRLVEALRVMCVCVFLVCAKAALASHGGGHGGRGGGGHAHAGGGRGMVSHQARGGGGHFAVGLGFAGLGSSPGFSRYGFARHFFPRCHRHGAHHGLFGFGWDYFAYPSEWYYSTLDPCSPYFDPDCNCYREPIGCDEPSLPEPLPPDSDPVN